MLGWAKRTTSTGYHDTEKICLSPEQDFVQEDNKLKLRRRTFPLGQQSQILVRKGITPAKSSSTHAVGQCGISNRVGLAAL